MPERDVGLMGEKEFEQWCSQVPGMVCNRAMVDAGSWDHLVQLPLGTSLLPRARSLDRLPTPLACLIQVKSRDSAENAPEIKLSNWRRMIDPSLPFFVLVLTFESQLHPMRAHLIPVGEDLIAKALHRLRQLDASDAGELHLAKMVVPAKDEHLLRSMDGKTLKEAIEAHVGPDPRAYHERKQRWHDTVGFDAHRYGLTLRTTAESGRHVEDRLVDFALGLTSELPSTLTRFEETRFGIAVPALETPREVTVAISKLPSTPATVEILRGAEGIDRVAFKCDFYNPRNLFPFIDADRLRFRFATRFVDFTLGGDVSKASITLNLPADDETVSWTELEPVFRLAEWLLEPVTQPLKIHARIGAFAFETSFALSGQLLNFGDTERVLVRAGLDAATVAHALKLDKDLRLSPNDLLVGAPRLADAAMILSVDVADQRVNSSCEADAPEGLHVGFPYILGATFGRTLVIAGIAYTGTPKFQAAVDGRKKFEFDNLKRELVFVDRIEMEPGVTYRVEAHVERLTKWLIERGFDVIPPDREVPTGGALSQPRPEPRFK